MEEILKGAVISSTMIIAIGGQNAFVLKQGLLRRHIFWVCLICFVCDAILMGFGVIGVGSIINSSRLATIILIVTGSMFLVWYSMRAFLSAWRASSALEASQSNKSGGAKAAVLSTLAVTLLNPHVYLDTVVVIGAVAGTLLLEQKIRFLIGATLVSCFWFFGLGYGAKLLTPMFKNTKTWILLDIATGCFMLWIAFGLAKYGVSMF